MTRSRLWRKLGATQPLFRVWNEGGLALTDHDVTSISISRGTNEPEGGIFPQTLTVDTIHPLPVSAERRIHVDLTDHASQLIRNLTGPGPTWTTLEPRFFGRIGKQRMDDRSPGRQYATLEAVGWEAQLSHIDTGFNYSAEEFVGEWIPRLASDTGANLPWLPSWTSPAALSQYGVIAQNSTEPATFSSDFNKWTTDLGLYAQTRRDGTIHVLSHQYRWGQATLRRDSYMPITRSQAVSPATWEQPAEHLTRNHRVVWTTNEGRRTQTFGEDPQNPNIPVVEHDMSHVKWTANQNQPIMSGRAFWERDRANTYRLPELTFDLLYLLTSRHESHRDQARQLLYLEVGDPMYFSGDWSGYIRGVHYAVGVDETITPDSWEMKISLAPSVEVVGEDSNDIPPKTWESATVQWSNATGTWES